MRRKLSNIKQLIAVVLVACCFGSGAVAQSADRSFNAEGTDTVFGLGARHLAMGGTGTATARGAHAVFWNPANLADTEQIEVSISRQLNATLRPYSNLSAAIPLRFAENFGLKAALGVARYPRVHAASTGAFTDTDPRSIFLRLLLPGITGTYDGDIDSKTMVNRLALGVSPLAFDQLSLGVNVDFIDCKTNSCGLHATSDGYEAQTVHATATSFGLSGRFRLGERVTLGVSHGDIGTTLRVEGTTTDDSGTRDRVWFANLPTYTRAEIAWQYSDRLLLAAGYQSLQGEYGSNDMKFETLHFGAELKHGAYFTSRFGVWAPLTIEASGVANIDLPVPAVPSIGVGYARGNIEADFAIYLHPMMSYDRGGPAPGFELSLTQKF